MMITSPRPQRSYVKYYAYCGCLFSLPLVIVTALASRVIVYGSLDLLQVNGSRKSWAEHVIEPKE
jgi:hypothetical protein